MRYPKVSVKILILFTFILLFLNNKYYTKESVLEETKKFVSRQTDEDDPELIEFIKKLIKPSSTKPYNLILSNIKNADFSQEKQSLYIDKILNNRTEGFFIGKYLKCIAKDKPMIARFKIGDSLSVREDVMDFKHKDRIKKEHPVDSYVDLPCFSLNTIMKALGVNKIDMFSLDVKGGELEVLKTIDLKNLDIKTLVIEHHARPESIKEYKEYFNNTRAKYDEILVTGQDSFYLKRY